MMRSSLTTRNTLDAADVDELYQRLSDIRIHQMHHEMQSHIDDKSTSSSSSSAGSVVSEDPVAPSARNGDIKSKMNLLRQHLYAASEKLNTRGAAADSYEVIWEEGLLGIVFKPQEDGPPRIRRITGKGSSRGIEHACIGDELVAINGRSVSCLEYNEVIQQLRNPCFPMFLSFQARPTSGAEATPYRETMYRPSARFSTGEVYGRESVFEKESVYDSESQYGRHSSYGRDSGVIREDSIYDAITPPSGDVIPEEDCHQVFAAKYEFPPLAAGEYDVLWERGVLGLSLTSVEGIPCVKRLTGKGVSSDLAKVSPGDFLVIINGKYTSDMSFQETLHVLQTIPRPALLRFISAKALPEEATEYSINWGDGPLGIVLEESPSGGVSIRRLTGSGLAAQTDVLSVGDELVTIASINVSQLGFKPTIQFLKSVAKPAQLVFRKVKNSGVKQQSVNKESDQNTNRTNSNDGSAAGLLPKKPASLKSIGFDDQDPALDTQIEGSNGSTKEIVLCWIEGPLGMTMKKLPSGEMALSRLTGRGTTPGIWKLMPNDILVSVNDQRTIDLGFQRTMHLLKTLPKPVTLVFNSSA